MRFGRKGWWILVLFVLLWKAEVEGKTERKKRRAGAFFTLLISFDSVWQRKDCAAWNESHDGYPTFLSCPSV